MDAYTPATMDGLAPSSFRQFDFLEASISYIQSGSLSPSQIQKLLNDLPKIEEQKLLELGEKDSFCPICFTPYLTILTEEEMALAMDTPAHPVEELGVTKLAQPWQCGHIFCRRDISKWISDGRDSCPVCRRLLVEPQESPPENNVASREEQLILAENLEAAMSRLRDLHATNHTLTRDEVIRVFNGTGLTSYNIAEAEDEGRQEYSGMYS